MCIQWSVCVACTPQFLPGHADMEEERGAHEKGSMEAACGKDSSKLEGLALICHSTSWLCGGQLP